MIQRSKLLLTCFSKSLRTFPGDSATPHLGMSAIKLSVVTWVPCECHRHDTDNFYYSFYSHCSHNEPPGTKLVSPATQLLPAWGQTSELWRQLTATGRQLYWSHSHYLCPVDRLRTSLTPTSIYWIPYSIPLRSEISALQVY